MDITLAQQLDIGACCGKIANDFTVCIDKMSVAVNQAHLRVVSQVAHRLLERSRFIGVV